jgi:DnaJ-class molecular chaperone
MLLNEALVILGLPMPYNEADVKEAFRRRVKIAHPDVATGSAHHLYTVAKLTMAKRIALRALCETCNGKGMVSTMGRAVRCPACSAKETGD